MWLQPCESLRYGERATRDSEMALALLFALKLIQAVFPKILYKADVSYCRSLAEAVLVKLQVKAQGY